MVMQYVDRFKKICRLIRPRSAVSASRLVKSPDSHASDPCSRLGGSSWLCDGIYFISEFNEMPEIFWGHLAWKAESSLSEDELSHKVLGPAVYTKIYCRVQRNWVLFIPVQWENRVTLTMKRIEAGRQFPMIKQFLFFCLRRNGSFRLQYSLCRTDSSSCLPNLISVHFPVPHIDVRTLQTTGMYYYFEGICIKNKAPL